MEVNSSHSKASSLIILSSPQRSVEKPSDEIPNRCAIAVKHGLDFDKLSGFLKFPYVVGRSDSAASVTVLVPLSLIRCSLKCSCLRVTQPFSLFFQQKKEENIPSNNVLHY